MAKSDRDVVILLAVVLLGTALVTYLLGGWVSSVRSEPKVAIEDPPLSKYEDHLLALDRAALDKAYASHIGLVFGTMLKDPNDPDAPRRAGNGARNARAGYEKSMDKIEQRERRFKESK